MRLLALTCMLLLMACGSSSGNAAPDDGLPKIVVDSNCEVLGADLIERCHEFVQNNFRYVVPALEDISGVKLETCYRQLHYRFGQTTSPNAGGEAAADGTIAYSLEMARFWFTSDPPFLFDSHELLHLLYDCIRIPGRANYAHTFWDPVSLALDRAVFERSAMAAAQEQAGIDLRDVTTWRDYMTAHPSAFDDPDFGCAVAETYLLYGEYLRQPTRPLVRELFDRVTHDPVLAKAGVYDWDPKYERAYLQIVSDLVVNAPDRDTLLARACAAGDR